MSATQVFNPNSFAVALPDAYGEALVSPGQSVVINEPPTTVGVTLGNRPLRLSEVSAQLPEHTVARVSGFEDATLYVDVAGDDRADGSSASPLATIGEALRRLKGASGRSTVQLGPGDFEFATPTILGIPAPVGVGAGASIIRGTRVDSGLGTKTVSAGTQGDFGSEFATVTVVGGGLTVNAWTGWILRFTGGANAGARAVIGSNTATVISLVGPLDAAAPANGDTFVIEAPGTALVCAGGLSLTGAASGVILLDLDFEMAAGKNLTVEGIQLEAHGCRFYGSGFGQFYLDPGGTLSLGAPRVSTTGTLPGVACGCVVDGIPLGAIVESGQINALRCLLMNAPAAGASIVGTSAGGSGVLILYSLIRNGLLFLLQGTLSLSSSRVEGVNAASAASGAIFLAGATAEISYVDVSGTLTGSAVHLTNGSVLAITGVVTGTGNGALGVRVTNGSKVVVADPNTGTSVTGTGGDIKVGANAAATWANIDANLAANTSDFAAASPQYCTAAKAA